MAALSRARNCTTRRAEPGRPPAASPPRVRITRRHCSPMARFLLQEVMTAAGISRARNSTIQRAGFGRRPGASPRHAACTPRRCCLKAKCSSLEVITAVALSRARNCTIRRAGPGRPRAASQPDDVVIRRPCCPTARCSSQEVITSHHRHSRERGTARSGDRDLDSDRQPRHCTPRVSTGDVAAQRQGARCRRF